MPSSRADDVLLGPLQAARHAGLGPEAVADAIEAGLLQPAGHTSKGTAQFTARDVLALADSVPAPIPGLHEARARLVEDLVQTLRSQGTDAWARHGGTRRPRTVVDWAPGPGLTVEDVRAQLPVELARAETAGRLLLLGPVGEAMHWAADMAAPNGGVLIAVATTGLNHDDEVAEITVLDIHSNARLVNTLVRPTRVMPAQATRAHGISDDMLASAPDWNTVHPLVTAATRGRHTVAYNAPFARRAIHASYEASNLPTDALVQRDGWECLMDRRAAWMATRSWIRLGGPRRTQPSAERARDIVISMQRPPMSA
ncbi:3'-5' exonuclease [Streptomyces sp. NPDC056056]|uniref:3'-5' exonuclease n=1 Tax=Streptomyces sp. NPDC056056 TaxID=3345698 RepID=UPI0035E0A09B